MRTIASDVSGGGGGGGGVNTRGLYSEEKYRFLVKSSWVAIFTRV